jgi:hypothetical protein
MKREREGFCARRFTGDDEHPAPKSDRSVHGMAKQGQAFARSGFDQQTGGLSSAESLVHARVPFRKRRLHGLEGLLVLANLGIPEIRTARRHQWLWGDSVTGWAAWDLVDPFSGKDRGQHVLRASGFAYSKAAQRNAQWPSLEAFEQLELGLSRQSACGKSLFALPGQKDAASIRRSRTRRKY